MATPSDATINLTKEKMKEVYSKGFNIYQCLARLKKKLKLTEDFPCEAIIQTCDEYLKNPGAVRQKWPWFLRVFEQHSRDYFANRQVEESKQYNKRGGFSQSIKDIMKGL
jgi:hypothetical protein